MNSKPIWCSWPARCVDCREIFPWIDLVLVEAIGLLCKWCARWRRIDLLAARVS